MKQEPTRIQKMLENIQPPQVEIPLHRRRLKTDLLKMHEQMRKNPTPPLIFNINSFMKKLLPLSLVALLAVVVVLNGTGMLSSSTASAQELIEQAISKVKAQVEKSGAVSGAQLQTELSSLEKAKDAKDLAYLGEEDAGEKGKVKKLSFTDEKGNKVTITFDEDDTEDPVDVEEENEEHENVAASTQESESQEREVKSETESKDKSGTEVEVKAPGESESEGKELNTSEKAEVSEISTDKSPETETEDSSGIPEEAESSR